ncbi:MAG: hypothetical protein DRG83_00225 [Deltaproteobacteria bacterium]|nr:MAG: hypothetical protein DRG83_00225 [Deltaproteobacteria bacterium]
MKLNKGDNIFDIYGLEWEDIHLIISELDQVCEAEKGSLFYPELIEKFWNLFEDDKKRAFAVFSLGRIIGILEVVYRSEGARDVVETILGKMVKKKEGKEEKILQ